jgi:hypothetical protein
MTRKEILALILRMGLVIGTGFIIGWGIGSMISKSLMHQHHNIP